MVPMIKDDLDLYVISGIDSEQRSPNAHLYSKLIKAADEFYNSIPADQPYKSYELYAYILKNVDELLSQKAQAELINSEKSIIIVNTNNVLLGVSSKGVGQNILGQVLLSIRAQLKLRNKIRPDIEMTYTPEDLNRALPQVAIAEDPYRLQEIRTEAKKMEYIRPPLPPLPLQDMEAFNKRIHLYNKRAQRNNDDGLHGKKEGKLSLVKEAKRSLSNLRSKQETSNVSIITPGQKIEPVGNLSDTRRSVFFKENTKKSNQQTYTNLSFETREHIAHFFSLQEGKIDDHTNIFTFGDHQFTAQEDKLTTDRADEKTFNMMLLLHINVYGANSLPTIETQPHLESLWREACIYTYGQDIGNRVPIEVTSPRADFSFN